MPPTTINTQPQRDTSLGEENTGDNCTEEQQQSQTKNQPPPPPTPAPSANDDEDRSDVADRELYTPMTVSATPGCESASTNGDEDGDTDRGVTVSSATTTQPSSSSTIAPSASSHVRPQLITVECARNVFQIPSHYKITGLIGQGAYGVVVAAIDTRRNEKVAIKKVLSVFDHDREYQKRILREIKILKHFRNHENIVSLKDLIPPKTFETFNDVYIVTELMDSDLRAIIRSAQELSDQNVQYFVYQILRGLKYVHSANVLHRDIKPSNILLNSDMDVRICDFGLSRGVDFDLDPTMSTPYVATRWYRAPELLLMWEKCSKALDMWSVGCIFAELLDRPRPRRNVLFPGKNYLNQLDLILDVCGTPDETEVRGCAKAKQYMKLRPRRPKKDWQTVFPHASASALDLLNRMLQFDPMKRITVEEALEHPYLQAMHDPEDEPVCEQVFDFQVSSDVDIREIKRSMYDDIMQWNREYNGIDGDAIVINESPVRHDVNSIPTADANAIPEEKEPADEDEL